ncbi:MAG: S41 family peptidase [Candidatus Aquicultorales bacterium]
MKRLLIAFGIILTALLFIAGIFSVGLLAGVRLEASNQAKLSSSYPSVERVGEAMHLIQNNFVDEVSSQKLLEGAIKGLLQATEDPYSHYLTKKDFGDFKETTMGTFEGVGMQIGANAEGQITVISPIDDTPASRAGIKSGDIIIEIDGKPTKGMSVDDAVSKIKGKKGTKVKLALFRKDTKEPIEVTLVREKINYANMKLEIMDDKYGYIQIGSFNEQTTTELKKKISEAKKKEAKGIILDLRGNPGGLLDEAVGVVSRFVDSGAVVKVKGRTGDVMPRLVRPDNETDTKIPLVILVSHGSASASEIVAGAIQDYNRGVVVGEKTFGKASVQTVINLQDGTAMLLTTDMYLTPNGRLIHKKGIEPDIKVRLDEKLMLEGKDPQMDKAKEVLQELIDGKRKP